MSDAFSTISSRATDHAADSDVLEDREPTVFSVLAERARGHPPAHLWGATLFGAADSVAVLIAYPSACAFGIWGLADEALVVDPYRPAHGGSRLVARAIRAGAVGLGVLAVLGAVFGLIGVLLGGHFH
jgi:hypothetical protein